MILLRHLPVCHYFFTRFFIWSGLSTKTTDDTALQIGEYMVTPGYREIVFKPSSQLPYDLIGNYEYIATNKGDFSISYEEDGTMHFELLREIDETVPVEYVDQNKFSVEYIPLPIDEEISGHETLEWKTKVDRFFDTIERQKMAIVNV